MRPTRTIILLHAALLALVLLVVFVFRTTSQTFYFAIPLYSLSIGGLTVVGVGLCLRAIQPDILQGQGTFRWYLLRGWCVSLLGAAMAILFIGFYAYQVDQDFFVRRLVWEEEMLVAGGMSEGEIGLVLEGEKLNEQFHAEEIAVGLIAASSGLVGSVVLSLLFGRMANLPRLDQH